MSTNCNYPTFFNTAEFADIWGVSSVHVRHAAKNYVNPNGNKSRAKLPEGWGAAMWGDVWIIYQECDAAKIKALFNLHEIKIPAGV